MPPPEAWRDHAALEAHLWARLARAVADAADPWRFAVLATLGAEGPQARTVGLRGADRAPGTVEVHADARTPKVAELAADPRAQLLLWDAAAQEQLRLSLAVEVVRAPADRWARVPPASRGNYGTTPAPGTPIPAAEAYARDPAPARLAALVGRVTRMDAVWLAGEPHRRAIRDGGGWRWVAP